ncbi:hypothetical protein A2524_01270 [Candidatus Wolfebacteria bacterium RIFOXYD12_FULL_48_21]|uniref:Type IV secretion system coupling protein TraD DNA-binding domain-containing protein n=1 Tax=Candidatus Wolfebacteria bacterium RIFOXYD1_FULL_48_65 TaxID=1802561 RepID=A0A1F8E2R3_9BACT|nr:MAG: hypothetical protein A2610_03215 [Candidatus Wolfebacteria bacterium RIFOXYD1_FULL_48_65]OGM94438.1 MAG: hypothetical protein A2524_01270 [Candidatus Wolfebacteria bacterium RIFOXYD12_FULL_48_21]OGM97391.1 MAG: hypothetical protein A2532_01915 [Candidatus Wolfebacteria bacterium RIFOXYD2_FULL_48_11]
MSNKEISIFAKTNFRNQSVNFGIKMNDRLRHMYIVGKSGTGKTTMMKNLMINDIKNGFGVAVLDPHGEFVEELLKHVPEDRIKDVIYVNPADIENPVGFNPLERVGDEHAHLVASAVMGVFQKIWVDAWSARMEYILNNTLLALLEYPGTTLLSIMRMLAEKEYRLKVVSNLKDPVIKSFWENEFAKYTDKFMTEAIAPLQNKVGQFSSNPVIRNIIGQPKSTIDMRKAMDEGKILICNLSQGRLGEDNSALLGAMIITKIQLAAMSRIDIPESERRPFFLYIDEFQNFSTGSFTKIFAEARKYGLGLTLAHQYVDQLKKEEGLAEAIVGNIGTLAMFRVGAIDAVFFEKEFEPEFTPQDMIGLSNRHIYLKLLVDGQASRPFSAETLPPYPIPQPNYEDVIIENSRRNYSMPKALVDEMIAKEYMGSGKASMADKVMRRDERSLGSTLTPRDYPPKREYSRSFGSESSSSASGRIPAGKQDKSFVRQPADQDRSSFARASQDGPLTDRPTNARPFSGDRGTSPVPHRPAMDDRSRSMPQDKPRHVFEKKAVNIDDLKKAIEESLQKRKEGQGLDASSEEK